MATNKGRFLEDPETRRALIDLMLPVLKDEYMSYKFVGKEVGFPGRVLIIYTIKGGVPTDFDILTTVGFSADQQGPTIYATSEGQGIYEITAVPMKWRGREIFFQVPQTFEYKWRGKQGERGLEFAAHFAMLVKTRSRVDEQTEGHTYCETLNEFRARFPGIPMRY